MPAAPANWSLSMNILPDQPVAQCSLRFPTADGAATLRLDNRLAKDAGPLSKGAAALSITGIDDQLLDGDETKVKGAQVKIGNAWTSGDVAAFWKKGDTPGTSRISITISDDITGPLQYLSEADSAIIVIHARDASKLIQVTFGGAKRAVAATKAA